MSVLNDFISRVVVEIINPIILLLAGGAFIAVVWGIVKFVMHAGDQEARRDGRDAIVWGLVGLVIIFGVYGILNLLTSTFNLDPVQRVTSPN